MARTLRNNSPYATRFNGQGRKAVQVRANRRNRHSAKQALVAGLEISVVRPQVDWDLH
jgi:hypothetical protein